MHNLIPYFLSIPLLIWLSLQDFKHRSIPVWSLIILASIAVLRVFYYEFEYEQLLFIYLFLLFQWFMVTVYFSLKASKAINIIDKYLGAGDVFFLLIIPPFFSVFSFILFYLTGLIISLISGILCTTSFEKKGIPLIGFMSPLVIVVMILQHYITIEFLYP